MGRQAGRCTKQQLCHCKYSKSHSKPPFPDPAQTNAIVVFLSPPTLLSAKLTFFIMYFQVFWPLRWLRITVYIGAVLTCIFYGAISVAQAVLLTPRHGETWFEHSLSDKCRKAQVLYVYRGAIGLGFDLLLLIMPLIAVLELQKPKQRQKGFLFVFFIGTL